MAAEKSFGHAIADIDQGEAIILDRSAQRGAKVVALKNGEIGRGWRAMNGKAKATIPFMPKAEVDTDRDGKGHEYWINGSNGWMKDRENGPIAVKLDDEQWLAPAVQAKAYSHWLRHR